MSSGCRRSRSRLPATSSRSPGRTGQGKTSILDAIWWALAGTRSHQPEPINRDHDQARIKLDLGELVVERQFARLPPAPGRQDERLTTRIIVTDAEGHDLRSPQTILDRLLGSPRVRSAGVRAQGRSRAVPDACRTSAASTCANLTCRTRRTTPRAAWRTRRRRTAAPRPVMSRSRGRCPSGSTSPGCWPSANAATR